MRSGPKHAARVPLAPASITALPSDDKRGPLLRLTNVSVYRDYRPVIAGLSMDVHAGEHWAIVGANGSGKTTLIATLYGDIAPALGGRIERSGLPHGSPIAEWKNDVGFVSPELQATYSSTASTLVEIVVSGLSSSIGLNEAATAADRRLALRALSRVRLDGVAQRRARQVSYGQLRRALIARALIRPRRLLLFDEPFDGLDDEGGSVVRALVANAVRRSAQVIIATHHREDIPRYVTRVLTLSASAPPRITSRR